MKETKEALLLELAAVIQDEIVARVEKGENALYLYLLNGQVFKINVEELL